MGSGKAATDLRIRLVRSMPNQGLSVEGRAETRLRGSQANRQGNELPLGLLIRRGTEMDLPGRHGGGAAVAEIAGADVLKAVSGVIGRIENTCEQPRIKALPVHIVPFVQVI